MHGGIEWLADGHGCSPARLRDRAAVVVELAQTGGATLAVYGELLGARELRVTEHARGSLP